MFQPFGIQALESDRQPSFECLYLRTVAEQHRTAS